VKDTVHHFPSVIVIITMKVGCHWSQKNYAMVLLLQFLVTGKTFRPTGAARWSRRAPRVMPSLTFRGGSSNVSTVSRLSDYSDDPYRGGKGERLQQQQSRSFWRTRGGGVKKELEDLSSKLPTIDPLLGGYSVSTCSIQGYRSYMEDEFIVTKDLCAVFDGHGGQAVSRYLRQNLYANLQAALPAATTPSQQTGAATGSSDSTDVNNASDTQGVSGEAQDGAASPVLTEADNNIDSTVAASKVPSPTVQDYEDAMCTALKKVDREVQRIVHWSYQGSTAVAAWIHEEKFPNTDGNMSLASSLPTQHTIITANVGDSRAILSRNASAIDLTRDHKPNDPIEEERIEARGGYVAWCGDTDTHGSPIEGSGIYRVNGNLALSRAIGDRSERPAVCADPEFSVTPITPEDEFLVLATDGLWDVMSSSDVVAFVHALLEAAADDAGEREFIANSVVEEALRRGSWDNITVIIVWLNIENIV
jgi:serine/threonine protein phosphatase PrpC